MARSRYIVQDDSVTVHPIKGAQYAGKSMTTRGEDVAKGTPEVGRFEVHPEGRDRPTGKSNARDASGVSPQDPIDSRMPFIGAP